MFLILYYIIAQNSRELGYYTFISSMDKHPFLYKKPLRGLVPRRELRPVELLANGHGGRRDGGGGGGGIALPELRPALLGRN